VTAPKAQLSALARAAANGEPTLLTYYGKPLAMIASIDRSTANQTTGVSDLTGFRRSLLAVPHAIEIDF
jgi:antitoxin (DNA-binding transcriptional repressor) of toxin-antitoxin stability system